MKNNSTLQRYEFKYFLQAKLSNEIKKQVNKICILVFPL